MKIIDVIENLKELRHLQPASEAEIEAAEQELGVTFAKDYREYVAAYGVISAFGVELTGVTHFPRLSVCNVTQMERESNNLIPSSMYVVDSTGLEGLVILQDQEGVIYSAAPNQEPKRIFDSLADYLESL